MKQPVLVYLSLGLLSFVLTGMALEPVAARDDSYRYLSNFSDTLDLIQKNYVDQVSLNRLMDGAYRGLLEELDPDSFYLDPRELKRFREESSVRPKADLGIDVSKRHGYAVVVSVLPGSPAQGKLATGDYIRVMDGASTREMSRFEIEQRLRGNPGSEIKLKVVRRETLDTEEITLARAVPSFDPLEKQELADGVVRLHLFRVNEVSLGRLRRELKAAPASAAIALDLRGCSLGSVPDGALLADLFLDRGLVLRVHGKTSEPAVKAALAPLAAARETVVPPAPAIPPASSFSGPPPAVSAAVADAPKEGYEFKVSARSEDTAWAGPLVVLTDGGTAGAAEVAAAALRDAGRAAVVGSRSFGRASIQDLILLEDGSALYLTVARVLTPRGDALLGKGLEPDETVEVSRTSIGDPVLEKAIERLRSNGRAKKAA